VAASKTQETSRFVDTPSRSRLPSRINVRYCTVSPVLKVQVNLFDSQQEDRRMFDRLGRVVCVECSSSMAACDVAQGEALFLCTNPKCNHSVVITWPTYPEGQERIRKAA
jgi:hypothetical protein